MNEFGPRPDQADFRFKPKEVKAEVVKATFEEALQDTAGSGLVFKIDKSNVAEAINSRLEVDQQTKDKLLAFGGSSRLLGHLFRLLSPGRSEAEHRLAMMMLDEYSGSIEKLEAGLEDMDALQTAFEAQTAIADVDDFAMAISSLRKVPSGDSADTVMWWTYSPYLSESLREAGVPAQEVMGRLLNWALPAAEVEGTEANRVHLPGLEFVNDADKRARPYILSSDPKGSSHAFTKEQANKMVEAGVV